MADSDIPPFLLQQIQEGKAVLFLGAGASLSAQNSRGQSPPQGNHLGALLADKFLGGSFKDRSLAQIAELAISEADLTSVQQFIHDIFVEFQPSAAHQLLPRLAWAGLATTNYDRLIESAYQAQSGSLQVPQVFIENGDRIEDKMRDPRSIKLLKLHGCITRLTNPHCPLILTTDQYITHRNGRTRLFDQLKDWAFERSIIFAGASLQDPDIRAIILELSGLIENRPRYFIVSPAKEPIEKRFWESKKISVISMGFEEFVTDLGQRFTGTFPTIPPTAIQCQHEILSRKTFLGVSLSRNSLQALSTDFDFVNGVTRTELLDPKLFYKGYNREWAAIEQKLDVKREVGDQILLDYVLVDEHEQKAGFTWVLIKASAGAGKSILLRRIAWESAKDYNCLTLFVKGTGYLNAAALQELAEVSGERIFLFIDDIGERIKEIQELAKQFEHTKSRITLISAERQNEWNVVGSGVSHLVSEEYELPYLSEPEIKQLLRLLTENNALGNLAGRPYEEQEAAFRDLAGRQLLVALHEATLGKRFEDIVEDEFNKIFPVEARNIYLTVCVLHRLGVPVRAGLISRLHGIRFSDFKERFFKPLEHVVEMQEDAVSKDMAYVSRHPVIADIVFRRALADQEERYDLYLKCLSALNIDYAADRKAFRRMIRGKTLLELFGNPDLPRTIYSKMSEIVGDDGYLLHQWGIYEMNRRNFKVADELLNRARTLSPHDPSVKHSLAELLLRSSETARTPLEREKMLSEATQLAQSIRGLRTVQSYSHHILVKIGIERLKSLLDEQDSLSNSHEIEAEVKSIEQSLDDGLQQYPGDSFLLAAEADFAAALKDSKRVTESLRKAFDANPRTTYLALRLSRQVENEGDLAGSEKILRKALDANRNEPALHFRLATLLQRKGNVDGDKLAYHLQRAFSPGDRSYHAQILFGRQLYINLRRDDSREVFVKLKEAKAPPELKKKLMFPLDGTFSGSLTKLDYHYGTITRDGTADWINVQKTNVPLPIWRNLCYGSRLRFRIYFSFYGPSAGDVSLEGIL